MNVKYHSGEVSDGNEEQIIGDWRKGSPCYKVANRLIKLCSRVLWKEEIVSNKIEYLAEEISKQRVGEAAWFLLSTYNKTQGERDKLKELLGTKI